MIRYRSIIGKGKFESLIKQELKSPLWYLQEETPEVPHIKLEIKIIGKEKLFSQERKPKKRRFLIFGKEK